MTQTRYVSPSGGNDANSGLSASQAWATIAYTKQQLRDMIAADLYGSIDVSVAGNRSQLDDTLEFNELDYPRYPGRVTWRAASGASPVISGGVEVDTWTSHDAPNNIWVADFAGTEFRQLYVDGERCYRARRTGLTGTPTATTAGFDTDDDVTNYANPSDIEFVFDYQWRQSRVKVASVVADTSVTMQTPAQTYYVALANSIGSRYPNWIENAYEILETNAEPGSFYWDRVAEKIYLIPPITVADPNDAEVIVPQLEKLMTFSGDGGRLRFDGIAIQHGSWLPTDGGFGDIQSMVQMNGTFVDYYLVDTFGPLMPACVEITDSEQIEFINCRASKLGASAFSISGKASRISFQGSTIVDISGHGITIGQPYEYLLGGVPDRVTIDNCAIGYCGQEFQGCVGVFAPFVSNGLIEHCEIGYLPYSGIGFGWGWGATRFQSIYSNSLVFRDNYVHDTMQVLNDGAALYVMGSMKNLVVEGNYFKGCPDGGIYLDQGTINATVRDNVVENCYQWIKLNWVHGNIVVEDNHSDTPSSYFELLDALDQPTRLPPPSATPFEYEDDAETYAATSPTTEQALIVNNAGVLKPQYADVSLPHPPIKLIASRVEGLGHDGGTSTPISTLKANLFVLGISFYNNAPFTMVDSAGNTWVHLGVINESTACIDAYYCFNPIVSAAHTITLAGAAQLSSIAFAAFQITGTFDKFNRHALASDDAIKAGECTPTSSPALHISFVNYYSGTDDATVDSGFTAEVFPFETPSKLAIGFAYKIDLDGGSEQPEWSWDVASGCAAYHLVFTELA